MQPSRASDDVSRPIHRPTAPSSRADLGPSFLARPGVNELRDQRRAMKAGEMDSSIRMAHPDGHVPARRIITMPGAHVLPYTNFVGR
jgi:hypothetical protein